MAAARTKPRPYHHGALREALIEASLAILAEEGLVALTLRSAARRVGVSHAAPANHFGDLRGLLVAVAALGFQRLAHAMAEAAAVPRDPGLRLVEIGRAYVRFACRSTGHFRAMFHPALGPRSADGELERASSAALEVLVSAIAAAQASGHVRAGDSMELSLTAWSLVHGLATLVVDQHLANKGLPHDADALAASLGRHLLHGIGNDAPARTRASSAARGTRVAASPPRPGRRRATTGG
ncbi:MAG: WHG domain-containing protein [Deltaproteobacteria bacterium]|nr:WHG domain-containing protein [Deltaproteobacteria bacterium]